MKNKKSFYILAALIAALFTAAAALPAAAEGEILSYIMPVGLEYIYINDGEACEIIGYKGSSNEISIPEKIGGGEGVPVISIAEAAFKNMEFITDIEIPESVTHIGDYAFSGTKFLKDSIEEFFIRGDGILIKYNGAEPEPVVPDGVKTVNYGAFQRTAITKAVLPDTAGEIKDFAFYECGLLDEIVLPDSLEHIGANVFEGCVNLTEITLPSSLKEIGVSAFEGCGRLSEIIIPENLTFLPDRIFFGCDGLKSVKISGDITSVGNCAFSQCVSLGSISFPGTLLSIGYEAFLQCVKLSSVNLGNGLKSVGDIAFCNCFTLFEVILPGSLTEIGDHAFGYKLDADSRAVPITADFTIWCDRKDKNGNDSAAYLYAAKNNFICEFDRVLGDVDGDGVIDAADARLILRYCAKLEDLSITQTGAAKVSKNEEVSAADARLVLRHAARLISDF